MRIFRTYILLFLVVCMPTASAFAAGTCALPITYSVGTIDSRFGISKNELVHSLASAESVWEAPLKRELFNYATSGGQIIVNLKYDSRQRDTDSAKAKLQKLVSINESFINIHAVFDQAASSTSEEQMHSRADFAAHSVDESAYNADVASSNARGGASQSEYEAFTAREKVLKLRFTALKVQESAINETVTKLNILSGLLNQLAQALNAYIARYNAAFKKGETYEEGQYVQNGALRMITIYEYPDDIKLTRALAHEMGHALGLGHVNDPEAIMYATNLGLGLIAGPEDVVVLEITCGFPIGLPQ